MATPLKRAAASAASRTKRTGVGELVTVAPSDGEFLSLLGRRVRAARDSREMPRKLLSELADVSERYLAQLEAGEGNASIILLRRVAAALGLSLAQLLDQEEQTAARQVIYRLLADLPPKRLEDVLQRLIADFGAEESVRRRRIALIGLRGAGKSTLGNALAKEYRRPFIELDREIEREAGMELSEIFLLYGQPGFRDFERRCLERIINSHSEVVLSVGGGLVTEPETYQLLLRNCYTLWIKATPEEHMSRVVAQGDMRPMKGHAKAMEDLKRILVLRDPLYARADKVIETSGQSVEKSFAALRRTLVSAPV